MGRETPYEIPLTKNSGLTSRFEEPSPVRTVRQIHKVASSGDVCPSQSVVRLLDWRAEAWSGVMSCRYTVDDLVAYVDREVDDTTRHGIREHLRDCEACRRIVREQREVADILRATPAPESPQAPVWDIDRFDATPAKQIHCTVLLPEASAYADGELDAEEATTVVAHLAACDPCHGAHRRLERVVDALNAAAPAPVPAGLEERILAAVDTERKGVVRPLLRIGSQVATPMVRVTVRLAAAAIFLMALTVGVLYSFGSKLEAPRAWISPQRSAPAVVEAPVTDVADELPATDVAIAEAPAPDAPARPRVASSSAPERTPVATVVAPPSVPTSEPTVRPIVDPGGLRDPADVDPTPPVDAPAAVAPSIASPGVPEAAIASVSPGGALDERPAGPSASLPGALAKSAPTDDGMGPVGPLPDPPPTVVARAGSGEPGESSVIVMAPRARVSYPTGSSGSGVDTSALNELARITNADVRAENRRSSSPTVTINH